MAPEDIAHRLIADGIAQVLQRALDTVLTPGAVLSRHPVHQRFNLGVDSRPSRILAMRGAVELLRD